MSERIDDAVSEDQRLRAALDLFVEVLDLAPDARDAILAARCGPDSDLRAEVERLLAQDAKTAHGRTLGTGAGASMALGAVRPQPDAPLPVLQGRYRITRVLGQGGMGTVYEAEQLSPRRLVALKALREGSVGETALRRFALEAKVLAHLQHPGIAQVYEAGFGEDDSHGPAWIAMELVRGPTLLRGANERGLSRDDRLRLFLQVCDAVAFAHQRGVIHRDLKPGNILLAEPDSNASGEAALGRVKVLDFGVARVLGDAWANVTGAASAGHDPLTSPGQLVGTLPYMSPEQVAGDLDLVDVRSDVYSLGVLLYELLAGRRPLEFTDRGIADAIRAVREDDPPSLGTLDPALRGDLSAIVARALAKSPRRRYESVSALAADVAAHLQGEPVSARSDSMLYVLTRRARRYRWPLSVAALGLAALVVFAVRAQLDAVRFEAIAAAERSARTEATSAQLALSRELSLSRLEQARLLAREGSIEPADKIVREEHAARPSLATLWSMREVSARHPVRAVLRAHDGTIRAITQVPGERAVTGGDDERIVLSSADGIEEACVEVGAICTSVSGWGDDEVVYALSDGRVERAPVANLARRELLTRAPTTPRVVSARGDVVAIGRDGGKIDLVRRDGTNLASFDAPEVVASFAWIDDAHLAAGTQTGRVRIIDVRDGSARFINAHAEPVMTIAVDGARHRIITGSDDRTVGVYDLDTLELIESIDAKNGRLRGLHVNADGTFFVAGWWSIDRWNPDTRERWRVAAIPSGANVAAFDEHVLFTSHGAVVRAWSPTPGNARMLEPGGGRMVCVFAPDGHTLAYGDATGSLTLIDTSSDGAGTRRELAPFWRRVRSLAFSPDGSLLAAAGEDRELRLYSVATGEILARRDNLVMVTSRSFAFSPDGTSIAAPFADGCARVMSVPTLSTIVKLPTGKEESLCVAYSPDGSRLATTARDKTLRLWSIDGTQLASATRSIPLWTIAFSHDGDRIAVGSWGRVIEVFDARSLDVVSMLRGPAGLVNCIEWHATEPNLLWGSAADGAVRLWDVAEQRQLFALEPFVSGDVLSISGSPDGRLLAASGAWGELCLWHVAEWDRWQWQTRDE
ncbi:MAG: serine/threonine-protein kinase [Phycisphaerales bacterium]